MSNPLQTSIQNLFSKRKITDEASFKASKTFCMMPWVHLFVSHFGQVAPCCNAPWEKEKGFGDLNEQSLDEIWNGEAIRAFRNKLLKDQPDDRCWQCYGNEKVGILSKRQTSNLFYGDKLAWALETSRKGHVKQAKPIYWDIRFSNQCNFRCRICGHHSSSSWYEDAKALGFLDHDTRLHKGVKDFDGLMRQLEPVLPELEEIYFAGGEPLIMEEHFKLLQWLLREDRRNIKLRYNTNFSQTIYKGTDMFDLWREFEDVFVWASLDGTGTKGEYQRKGQDWAQAEANRKRMLEKCPDVDFLVSPTISVFNAFHLPDFHREWVEQGLIAIDEFMPRTLKTPEYYNVRILPPELKQQITTKNTAHINWIVEQAKTNPPSSKPLKDFDKYKDHLEWVRTNGDTGFIKLDIVILEFRKTLDYMNGADETHRIPEFLKMTAALDKLRKESTAATFPELASMFEAK